MWIATASLPADLAQGLASGNFAELADRPEQDPATSFARGIALVATGRSQEARGAFQKSASDPNYADAADVEIGFLDLNTPASLAPVADCMTVLLSRTERNALLFARANHLLGVTQFRLLHAVEALDALTIAQQSYANLHCDSGESQVLDSLGLVHQWMGDESAALVSFAHSLALKMRVGDQHGAAITLGNLGRYCAVLGRTAEAKAFLELDLQVAEEKGDARGEARVLSDLAEIARDDGKLAEAKDKLVRALALARSASLQQLEFEIRLNLATTALALGANEDARRCLDEARHVLAGNPTTFDQFLLDLTEAKLIAPAENARAVQLVSEAVRGFRDADAPALEIEARLTLCDLLLAGGKKALAENETLVALKRARERNLPRFRVRIGELMEQLSLVEGVAEESGKTIDDKPSATFDGYLVRERLGGGAFATVYRAFDVERAREVALKVFDLEQRYAKSERDRILDSARLDIEAANRVRHPGLVRVYAIGRDVRGNVYLADEYIAGPSLRERMDGKPARDPKLVCSTLADVADALSALHGEGVVHRDLKPENIMLRADGSPVIIDFGIAHLFGARQSDGEVSRGTPEYFSPQQAKGENATPADDMYSFGVILGEWLTGARPVRQPERGRSLFGGHAAPRTTEELVAALLSPKSADRPTAGQAAALLRSLSA